MDKGTLTITAMKIKRARHQWAVAQTRFAADMDTLLTRMINEAAVNRMSAEETAALLGISPKRVRTLMRQQGLDPKKAKSLLAEHAAETLANNAALMGIDVRDMDLMSPLAYLPMGQEMRAEILGASTSQVKDICQECGAVSGREG